MSKLIFGIFFGILLCDPSFGFVPNALYSVYGKIGSHHEEISVCALNKIAVQYLNKIGASMSRAMAGCTSSATVKSTCKGYGLSCLQYDGVQKAIVDANAQVDKKEAKNPFAHFDAESFYDANQGIITAKQAAIKAMKDGEDYVTARQTIGRVMHTLQDFYSHSNWIELGKTKTNAAISRHNDLGNLALPQDRTCGDCQRLDCFDFCLPLTSICQNVCILPNSGCLKIPTTDYQICAPIYRCDGKDLKTNKITSGYFGGQSISKPSQGGKCSHGGIFDSTASISGTGGINKDTSLEIISPHFKWHDKAAVMARDATFDLLRDVWDQVGDTRFGRFLGITGGFGSLVIVMDTTGSMKGSIDAAKQTALKLADEMKDQPEPPINYILSPFNDPQVGPLFLTEDVDKFKAEINKLYAGIYGDGGDEPEMCLSGILAALKVCEYNSKLFVFTDANAKDIDLQSEVLSLAAEKKSEINFLLTDPFSRASTEQQYSTRADVDKTIYQAIAGASGGQMVSTTNKEIMEVSLNMINAEDILKSSVDILQLTSPGATSGTASYDFTVDDSIDELILDASATSGTLTSLTVVNLNPSSPALNLTRPTDVTTVKVIRVALPPAGVYRVTVNTKSPFTLKVRGISVFETRASLGVMKLDGHPGFFDIESQPVAGSEISVQAEILGDTSDATSIGEAKLVDEKWQVLSQLNLTRIGSNQFSAKITVPKTPFRILINGEAITRAGSSGFQRLQPNLFTPAYVDIVSSDAEPQSFIQVNHDLTIEFMATNYGPSATVDLTAADTAGLIQSFSPSSKLLDTNESVVLSVKLRGDPKVAPGAVTSVTASVLLPGASQNYATTSLIVMPEFIDSRSPTIDVTHDTSSVCHTVARDNCADVVFELVMAFNDSESGLSRVFARNEEYGEFGSDCTADYCSTHIAMFTYSNFTEGVNNATVSGQLLASCCFETIEVVATDVAGNLRLYVVEVELNIAPGDDIGMILGIVFGVLGFLIIVAVFVGLVFREKLFPGEFGQASPEAANQDIEIEVVSKRTGRSITNELEPPESVYQNAHGDEKSGKAAPGVKNNEAYNAVKQSGDV